MRIIELSSQEISYVYRQYLTDDFPREERKPLLMIRRALRQNTYQCLGWVQDDVLLGYAFFVRHGRHYLLDYYAIVPEHRDHGIGTAFMAALADYFAGCGSFLVEVEDPAHASSEAGKAIRERRLQFYLRCGFRDCGIVFRTFGVAYRILELAGLQEQDSDAVADLYTMHYKANLPAPMFRRNIERLQ